MTAGQTVISRVRIVDPEVAIRSPLPWRVLQLGGDFEVFQAPIYGRLVLSKTSIRFAEVAKCIRLSGLVVQLGRNLELFPVTLDGRIE